MKKMFVLLLVLVTALRPCSAFANITLNREAKAEGALFPVLFPALDDELYIGELGGEQYVFRKDRKSMKYNESVYNFFQAQGLFLDRYDYLWTGRMYIFRDSSYDVASGEIRAHYWRRDYSVKFYDADFNLIKECYFDRYVYDMSYFNDIYYCYLKGYNTATMHTSGYDIPDKIMMSADLENWKDVSEKFDSFPKVANNIMYAGNRVSFDGINFNEVNYESKKANISNAQVYGSSPPSVGLKLL
jgi:hypothetical protein